MYVATHNIWDTQKAYQIAKTVKKHSSVALIQEINEQKSNNELEEFLRGLGPEWDLAGSFNPIAYDKNVLRPALARELPNGFQNRGVLTLHPAVEGITGARKLTWAIFKHVNYPNLPPVAFVNLHLQHRAWNGKERNRAKLEIRRDNWYRGMEVAQWCISNLLKYGLTTTWGGDYNRRRVNVPSVVLRQMHVAGDGIDFLSVARGYSDQSARVRVYADREKRIDTPSDHPLIAGNVQFLMP